ncbi:MAG: endoglucanase [Frankiaceae bacterium]
MKPTAADGRDVTTAVSTLQRGIGRRLDIVHVYRKWEEPFPGQTERAAIGQGSTPMISWAGSSTTAIAGGADDALIEQRADAVRALGVPVLLRWSWEMDRPAVAGTVGSGADYVAAWRHLRSVFAGQGATNAQWVWCPTSFGYAQNRVDSFYPGDSAVDWLCADGYTGPSVGGWRSFGDVFQGFYDWAASHPKPLMIGEFGVPAGAPGQREAWLRDAQQTLKTRFPRIKAVVYFDAIRLDGQGNRNIWTLRGYPAALAAFGKLVEDPYFNTRRLPAAG